MVWGFFNGLRSFLPPEIESIPQQNPISDDGQSENEASAADVTNTMTAAQITPAKIIDDRSLIYGTQSLSQQPLVITQPSTSHPASLSSRQSNSVVHGINSRPASPPKSKEEAKSHILCIRNDWGVDKAQAQTKNQQGLEGSLNLLSDQMNSKPSHFLLEMIQNADDTQYSPTTEPSLSICYRNRTLRFDSNQIGFTMKDVEAICSISQSTKPSCSSGSSQQIGNKGIGFKSVFKVADVVWILSGFYSLKFVKSNLLGRVAPVWDASRQDQVDGITTFHLELSQECDAAELIKELKSLDSRVLMFLRKLSKVNVHVVDEEGGNYTATLVRSANDMDCHGCRSIHFPGDDCSSFTLISYQVCMEEFYCSGLGPKQTDIIFGFPPKQSGETYDVYAFLPIRDYGFEFVIQADFHLITSREDIDTASTWNQELIQKIPLAFVEAVERLNSGGHPLRHSWPRFVPLFRHGSDCFKELRQDMLSELSSQPVLEALGGNLVVPSQLVLVPRRYTDGKGNPLIPPHDGSTMFYISPQYSGIDDHLIQLGVRPLSEMGFLREAERFVEQRPGMFHDMPNEWHSCFAVALDHLVKDHRARISEWKIIPLSDGRWMAPNFGSLFFPFDTSEWSIPNGIGLYEVDQCVASDQSRRNLARQFNIESPTTGTVCKHILSTHRSRAFRPYSVSTTDIISHITFLYQHSWEKHSSRKPPNVWFTTEAGLRCVGTHLYLESDGPFSARQVFAKIPSGVHFLHCDYKAALDLALPGMIPDWASWLEKSFGLAAIPRLADSKFPYLFSKEFQTIAETPGGENIILQVLRAHWKSYKPLIVDDAQTQTDDISTIEATMLSTKERLRIRLSSIRVRCSDGMDRPLNETYLPRDNIQHYYQDRISPKTLPELPDQPSGNIRQPLSSTVTSISPLLVPEPQDAAWDFLKHFGVVVQLEPSVFIERLKQLRRIPTTTEQVAKVYGDLQACTEDIHHEFIRSSFAKDELIYIPMGANNDEESWVKIVDCVWDGPPCLRRISRINDHYGGNAKLFITVLGLTEARLITLLHETALVRPTDSLEHITTLFLEMARFESGKTALEIKSFQQLYIRLVRRLPIFPVWTRAKTGTQFELAKLGLESSWYIADKPHFLVDFQGKIPLLAINPGDVPVLERLFRMFNVHQRMLSVRTTKRVEVPADECILDPVYSGYMQEKGRSLARLIHPASRNLDQIISQLGHIHVLRAHQIHEWWDIDNRQPKVSVRGSRSGIVAIKSSSRRTGIDVYLLSKHCKIQHPPLELIEEFANFCDITDDRERMMLLSTTIMQTRLDDIEIHLERRGMSNDIPKWDVFATHGEEECYTTTSASRPGLSMASVKSEISGKHATASGRHASQHSNQHGESMPANLSARVMTSASHSVSRDGSGAPMGGSRAQPRPLKFVPMGTHKPSLDDDGSIQEQAGDFLLSLPPSRFPGKQTSFMNMRTGIMAWPFQITAFQSGNEDETNYFGELYVSCYLESLLGRNTFRPNKHWTSPLRSHNGHKPFTSIQGTHYSTFTIPETNGKLRDLVTQSGQLDGMLLDESCTFHIEVCTTNEKGLYAPFPLSNAQCTMARTNALDAKSKKPAKDICILSRIYNVQENPGMAWYLDPWGLHLRNLLLLESESHYQVSISTNTNAILDKHSAGMSFDTATHITYRDLDVNIQTIRLLRLQLDGDTESLRGRLEVVHIDEPSLIFWAISYVWGPKPTPLWPFYLITEQGKIPITESLSACLRSLRRRRVSVLLWADAVCINQEDNVEKSMQVRRMDTLYSRAKRVIVWMGGDSGDHQGAIDMLAYLQGEKAGTPPLVGQKQPQAHRWDQDPTAVDKCMNAFLRRPWFTRTWTLQELVFGRDVMVVCGDSEIRWGDMVDGITRWQQGGTLGQGQSQWTPVLAMQMARKHYKSKREKLSLLELLEMFFYTQSTWPRDKLFALLNMAHDGDDQKELFYPDYDSSDQVVLGNYARCFVEYQKTMDLLYRAGISKTSGAFTPSTWIPDLMNHQRQSYPPTISTWEVSRFSAGPSSDPHMVIRDDLMTAVGTSPTALVLAMRGRMFEAVESVRPLQMGPCETSINFSGALADLRAYISCLRVNPEFDQDWEDELLVKSLTGDANRPYTGFVDFGKVPSWYYDREIKDRDKQSHWVPGFEKEVLAVRPGQDGWAYSAKSRTSKKGISQFWRTAKAFTNRIPQAAFCLIRKKGYTGIMPGATKAGDLIFIPNGSRVPFVIRKRRGKKGSGTVGNPDFYTLVGECYVHNLMYFEHSVIQQSEEEEIFLI